MPLCVLTDTDRELLEPQLEKPSPYAMFDLEDCFRSWKVLHRTSDARILVRSPSFAMIRVDTVREWAAAYSVHRTYALSESGALVVDVTAGGTIASLRVVSGPEAYDLALQVRSAPSPMAEQGARPRGGQARG